MKTLHQDYSLFFRFIDEYKPSGYKGIDRKSQLMNEFEELMNKNNQFIYLADAIHLNILFTSKRSKEMIGVLPEDLTFYHFMERTHEDDLQRLNIGRTVLLKKAQDIFIAGQGKLLLSTNFRLRNAEGKYFNCLMQNFLFYSSVPYKTVLFPKSTYEY